MELCQVFGEEGWNCVWQVSKVTFSSRRVCAKYKAHFFAHMPVKEMSKHDHSFTPNSLLYFMF